VVSFTPRPLYRRERALGTYWIGGCVGLRVSLDTLTKNPFVNVIIFNFMVYNLAAERVIL
jgi:hypothetical protein